MTIASLGNETQRSPERLASGARIDGDRPTERTCPGEEMLG